MGLVAGGRGGWGRGQCGRRWLGAADVSGGGVAGPWRGRVKPGKASGLEGWGTYPAGDGDTEGPQAHPGGCCRLRGPGLHPGPSKSVQGGGRAGRTVGAPGAGWEHPAHQTGRVLGRRVLCGKIPGDKFVRRRVSLEAPRLTLGTGLGPALRGGPPGPLEAGPAHGWGQAAGKGLMGLCGGPGEGALVGSQLWEERRPGQGTVFSSLQGP